MTASILMRLRVGFRWSAMTCGCLLFTGGVVAKYLYICARMAHLLFKNIKTNVKYLVPLKKSDGTNSHKYNIRVY